MVKCHQNKDCLITWWTHVQRVHLEFLKTCDYRNLCKPYINMNFFSIRSEVYYDIDTARLLFLFIASLNVVLNVYSKIDALLFLLWSQWKLSSRFTKQCYFWTMNICQSEEVDEKTSAWSHWKTLNDHYHFKMRRILELSKSKSKATSFLWMKFRLPLRRLLTKNLFKNNERFKESVHCSCLQYFRFGWQSIRSGRLVSQWIRWLFWLRSNKPNLFN